MLLSLISSVLHGGSVDNAATSTLAFLNTTSWTWSTPKNLQPPASSAASYHTSVITPQGVMITAFGLGTSGSPSSNVFYLDMRDPSQGGWTWKSYWNKDMLQAYSPTTATNSAINTASTISTDAAAAAKGGSGSGDKKKVTSIVVPVLIAALILLPLAIWFTRRKIRLAKKRRMARHFSFETQEDEGEFRSANTLNQPSRRTKTQYGFGTDANEKDGNMLTDLAGAIKRFSRRRRSVDSISTTGEQQMSQVANTRVSRLDERTMRWEEIDFGLGKLDERAQSGIQSSSAPAPAGVASTIDPFADPAPLIRFDSIESDASNRMGTPLHDGQQQLIPEVNVQPPTVPPTPMPMSSVPAEAFQPSAQDGLDWNLLAQEMQVRPAFRSISPTSTLRSHAHPVPSAVVAPRATTPTPDSRSTTPTPISPFDDPPTSLPYVDDRYTPAPAVNRLPRANEQWSSGPPRLPSLDFSRMSTLDPLRPSAPLPPRTSSHALAPSGNRAVSQPVQGRQLAGSISSRRDSAPQSTSSSGSSTPTPRSPDFSARRSSNPAVLTRSPGSPVLAGTGALGSPSTQDKRDSAMSKLRVMNLTEEDEMTEEGGR